MSQPPARRVAPEGWLHPHEGRSVPAEGDRFARRAIGSRGGAGEAESAENCNSNGDGNGNGNGNGDGDGDGNGDCHGNGNGNGRFTRRRGGAERS